MATYPVFLCHVWSVEDGMERINSLMADYSRKKEGKFQYEFRSVSKDDPVQFLRSNKALIESIETQMEQCCCAVLLAGIYEEYKRWTNLELDASKKLKVPLILVQAADPRYTSYKEKRAANAIIDWDDVALGEAIEQFAKKSKIIADEYS